MVNCYICGSINADKPLVLKDSFTGHSRCKSPASDKLCQRCYDCIEGKYKQCWYFHPTKQAWSKLWGRNWSWLISEDVKLPQFEEEREGLLVVSNLPTREQMREWLLNPPMPPFTICIADSGQKHTYPFSVEAHSRELFPVLFEETLIYCERTRLTRLFEVYESLMGLGFTKSEIDSGNYRVSVDIDLSHFLKLEEELGKERGGELFKLVGWAAKKL